MRRMILRGPDFCAVTEDGRLVEYIRTDPKEQSGDILLGKIDRMMPGMNCAFADIGRKKNGFLPLEENGKTFREEKPKSGETLILQIRKEETGEKGAFLTRDITLAGTYVILMSKNRYIGVSSRIEDAGERERLKQLGHEIAGDRFGLVMRHSAPEAGPEEIREEAETLNKERSIRPDTERMAADLYMPRHGSGRRAAPLFRHIFSEDQVLPSGGDDYLLYAILQESWLSYRYREAKAELSAFLAQRRDTGPTERATFYLAEAEYFTGNYLEALNLFVSVQDSFPQLAGKWIDSCLDLM